MRKVPVKRMSKSREMSGPARLKRSRASAVLDALLFLAFLIIPTFYAILYLNDTGSILELVRILKDRKRELSAILYRVHSGTQDLYRRNNLHDLVSSSTDFRATFETWAATFPSVQNVVQNVGTVADYRDALIETGFPPLKLANSIVADIVREIQGVKSVKVAVGFYAPQVRAVNGEVRNQFAILDFWQEQQLLSRGLYEGCKVYTTKFTSPPTTPLEEEIRKLNSKDLLLYCMQNHGSTNTFDENVIAEVESLRSKVQSSAATQNFFGVPHARTGRRNLMLYGINNLIWDEGDSEPLSDQNRSVYSNYGKFGNLGFIAVWLTKIGYLGQESYKKFVIVPPVRYF